MFDHQRGLLQPAIEVWFPDDAWEPSVVGRVVEDESVDVQIAIVEHGETIHEGIKIIKSGLGFMIDCSELTIETRNRTSASF
jgi:hypothetical protein